MKPGHSNTLSKAPDLNVPIFAGISLLVPLAAMLIHFSFAHWPGSLMVREFSGLSGVIFASLVVTCAPLAFLAVASNEQPRSLILAAMLFNGGWIAYGLGVLSLVKWSS